MAYGGGAFATRAESARNFCLKQPEKPLRFPTGILRTHELEGLYATIVDLADLSTRVVSFGRMPKRAKSLKHLKTVQKPEKRMHECAN